jgi:hypothetical protein
VFRAFKLEIATADPQSPWRPMIRLMGAEHYSQESLKERLWVIEATGDFDWNAYVTSVRAPAILSRIVRRFHDAGTHVVVVLMPEHSWVVAREPVGGAEHIRKTLLARVGEEGVQFIDYRRAVDDSGFVDLVHLNTAGSRQFSRILAGEIRRIALMHPPLMNGAAGARPAASRGRAPTDGMVR